jgi:hypothetical protein
MISYMYVKLFNYIAFSDFSFRGHFKITIFDPQIKLSDHPCMGVEYLQERHRLWHKSPRLVSNHDQLDINL